ncbi:MAG: type IV pilus twitching motility protein PilT [Candidatus Sumerlaeia bacterium]|nr:type IV pilus twitching motility protein PilT [Candidatus Sumerlaeia bacterium]
MLDVTEMLRECVNSGSSDLHLAVGRPPVVRLHGVLQNLDQPPLSAADTRRMIYGILTDLQKQKFEEHRDLDFSLSVTNVARFRVNVHFQRGTVAGSFRVIAKDILGFEELGLPPKILTMLARRPNGLTLVTGPTGSGKSTTLAAVIDLINRERPCHIITAEDPIEYIHAHKMALVEQREIGEDCESFSLALKYALRQDPDVILVGEMRDLETIGAAVTAAETGHLVFSTLHTVDVVQTVDRIIDVFPPHQQEQIRVQLAGVTEGILAQRLLPKLPTGRIVALEILIGTDAVRNMIREGKTHQILGFIEAGAKFGMQTMDKSIHDLARAGLISKESALMNARKPEEMRRQLGMAPSAQSGEGVQRRSTIGVAQPNFPHGVPGTLGSPSSTGVPKLTPSGPGSSPTSQPGIRKPL